MTKAEDVLRKCLSGKKLNTDKWSKNKKCNQCPKTIHGTTMKIYGDDNDLCEECHQREGTSYKERKSWVNR